MTGYFEGTFCKTMNSDELELRFLQLITRQYYEVVPEKYRTFCVFNARLLQMVLTHYRIASELMPCQIWLSRADDSIVLGFLDSKPRQVVAGMAMSRAARATTLLTPPFITFMKRLAQIYRMRF